jgi:ribokinase
VGLVGDDPAGRLVRDALVTEGVDTTGLVLRPGVETSTSVILVVGEHRTICERHQEVLPLEPAALEPVRPALDRCRFLLVDGRMPEAQAEAARRVRAAGGRVMLDAGHRRPGAEALLPLTDIAILSRTYLTSTEYDSFGADTAGGPERGATDPNQYDSVLVSLVRRLAPGGLGIVGLTLGREGCIVRSAEAGSIRVPGHEIDALDTTGAGDVFHAGFVAALLDGMDLTSAARFANAAAALKCAGKTSRAPVPGKAEVRRFAGLP